VVKVNDESVLKNEAARLLAKSDLVIAQGYLPTEFDWRVGVFDGQPLWVAKYFMAHKHWQIYKNQKGGRIAGKVECIKVDDTPEYVIKTALRATKLIGNGLYGVDIKTNGKRTYVVEVNDNPSVEAGVEDQAEGDALYDRIMGVFLKRLEARFLSGVHA
jgi:glutathione synthase/RimK-type ligase-like ATP-grasp enzyme